MNALRELTHKIYNSDLALGVLGPASILVGEGYNRGFYLNGIRILHCLAGSTNVICREVENISTKSNFLADLVILIGHTLTFASSIRAVLNRNKEFNPLLIFLYFCVAIAAFKETGSKISSMV